MKKDLKKTVDTVNTISFVVDVGNSHTVIGIFKDTKVVDYWRLTTRKETTSDEVMNKVGGLLRFSRLSPKRLPTWDFLPWCPLWNAPGSRLWIPC